MKGTELLERRAPVGQIPAADHPNGRWGHDGVRPGDGGHWGGDDSGDGAALRRDAEGAAPAGTLKLGIWILLAAVTMLFVGFTSTYLVRRGAVGWVRIPFLPILGWNTVVLLASSVTMERARRVMGSVAAAAPVAPAAREARRWLGITGLFGVVFVVGQGVAWNQLGRAGFLLPTTPHASFLYLLSAMHALHVLGGLGGLAYTWKAMRQGGERVRPAVLLDALGLYWHFMDGLWVYLMVLLFGV